MSASSRHAVAADHVFDGTVVHRHVAVVIEDGRIAAIVPRSELPPAMTVRALPEGAWLAPGFIDLQVNGGGDVLFNDAPTKETISTIAAAHRTFGTTAFLPTFISDTPEKTSNAIAAVATLVDRDPSVLGIHLEGPFLSPEKPGVHDPRALRAPTKEDVQTLTRPRKGAMLVTLAPERVPKGFIRQLTTAGIRVSLGHSMATYDEARAAMAEGATGFTHLFNAMRPLASREGGLIAAALESPDAWFGMIVDGIHVDPAMLRLALRGAGHPMLVTDAMPPVGGVRQSFMLAGEEITVRDGRCARADGALAGAMLDMSAAVRNCVRLLGLPLASALRLASSHPADFIGLGHVLGRLAPHYRADMVALDPDDVRVIETWVAGA
jgi:N-acetylglucosamine-6-phosphate deacetylase